MASLKVKLKPSSYILKEEENKYKFILTGSRRVLTFNVDSLVKEVINSLKEERDYNELIAQLSKKYQTEDNDILSTLKGGVSMMTFLI
jgi:hypothetical protein